MVRNFCEIDFCRLADLGIRNYCFDLDNTILPQRGEVVAAEVLSHLHQARQHGWIQKICLLSNVIWTRSQRQLRLQRLAREMEIPLVYGSSFWTRKPKPAPYRWALREMGARPEETAMVGDQVFTDVVGGNRMGFYTVLVKPMSADHWTTTAIGRRLKETLFMRHYQLSREELRII